jgi:hypothetical protein
LTLRLSTGLSRAARIALSAAALMPIGVFAEGREPAAAPSSLPDAPSAVASAASYSSSNTSSLGADPTPFDEGQAGSQGGSGTKQSQILRPRVKFIGAGQSAAPQSAEDKVILGIRESVTPFAVAGWFLSAGWSHLIDSSPNYGVSSKAFAQRLGAAAALNSSKEIFSDSVLAPVFHQDPRYYQLGPSHKFMNRVVYAGTRPIIGRTDGGKTIPNFAFILGTGGASALTHTYYPERNVTPGQVMQTWATSLGGSAVGYLFSEFGGEVVQMMHLPKFISPSP